MPEFDLQSLWDDSNKSAAQWYSAQREQLLTQTTGRSQGVLRQLQRQFRREMTFSSLLGGLLLFGLFDPQSILYWLVVVFWLGALGLMGVVYYRFQREIARVPLLDVKTATAAYLALLRSYSKQLVRLYWLLGPIGLVLGYYVGFSWGAANVMQALQDWKFWVVSLCLLGIAAYLGRRYASWRYERAIGRRIVVLEEIVQSLEAPSNTTLGEEK